MDIAKGEGSLNHLILTHVNFDYILGARALFKANVVDRFVSFNGIWVSVLHIIFGLSHMPNPPEVNSEALLRNIIERGYEKLGGTR